MSIEKMMLVNIAGQIDGLDRAIEKCVNSECFHIESASSTFDAENSGFVQLREENPYKDILSELLTINLGEEMKYKETDFSDVADMPFEKLEEYVKEISEKSSVLNKEIEDTKKFISEHKQILTQLKHLHGMEIDMESLFRCKYVHVRFGKLPVDSYIKLQYYDTDQFIFVHYDVDDDYYWGMYLVPVSNIKKADKIFSDLYFERIWVPDYVTGKPDEEIEDVRKKYDEALKRKEKLLECQKNLINAEQDKLIKVFCRLKYLYDCFELRSKASVLKDKFLIVGFVSQKDSEKFVALFDKIKGVSVALKPPDSEMGLKIPVKLKTNKFTNPFSMFVEMYGMPDYGGFNPINLVAISYTLIFGIMFGDLGHGLVLAILGALLYKKTKNKLCAIISRIGISSAFFGLIFGSVFGFEHLLDPLYRMIGFEEKPIEVIENVNVVLISAIALGVVLIMISIVINIISSLKKKEYDKALFGNNGITGLVFFGAIIFAVLSMFVWNKNIFTIPFVMFFIILPLVVMLFREPLGCVVSGKKYKYEGMGDFIASNFFEVFEFVLGYVTNTLSFVRIGGFVLSHAAMMSVVMLLSEMYQGASPVIIVLGNIFVIGVEGMLSGIQALRLEFYEIFSRCYDGDGKPFEPVRINYEVNPE